VIRAMSRSSIGNADSLNAEAEEALQHQAPWDLDEPKKSPARKKGGTR